jgi:hypothetical protein
MQSLQAQKRLKNNFISFLGPLSLGSSSLRPKQCVGVEVKVKERLCTVFPTGSFLSLRALGEAKRNFERTSEKVPDTREKTKSEQSEG